MPDDLNDPQLSLSEVRHIDQQCDEFESAWNNGERPQIEDFIAGRPEPESSHLFRELLKVDVDCRICCGGDARLSEVDYRHRFPNRDREISAVFSLTARESATFGVASTRSMFPGDLPHQIDKYDLLNRIGRGGMGEVYRARHIPLNSIVALKLINAKQIENPLAVARFKQEIKAVGKLDHPNIVKATDAGEFGGMHYLAMELVEGIDLARVIRRLGRLSVADACEILRQAAMGMAHAHEKGLIHRDLKPSNLMLTKHVLDKSGQVKVLDMGLARLLDPGQITGEIPALTTSGQAMGTPEYMAPEQVRNTTAIDQRVDVYSFGCTLYEFLVGQPPFPKSKHGTPIGVLMAQVNEPLPPVIQARPELPASLVEIVGNLLAKNPDERTASMEEVVSRLEPFARSSNIAALLDRARQYPPVESLEGDQQEDDKPDHVVASDGRSGLSRRQILGALGGGALVFAVATMFLWPDSGTDVLAMVDPQRDRMRGDWRLTSGRLESPRDGVAILRLPYTTPTEFDLDAIVDREYGLMLSFVHIDRVTPFLIRFGSDVEVTGPGPAKGRPEHVAGTVLSASWPLHRQEASRLRIEVRKRRLLVRLNDEQPLEWKGDFTFPGGVGSEFGLERDGLYLCTEESEFRILELRIADRTGKP
ncbi:MAG: serine/threonine protein kinase [Planctomycetes bacterium]|nr:serine/threonine protein kinase [Planctomycetota bacterium]